MTFTSRGFTAVKFGWGVFGQEKKRDIALVAAAREALGPDVALLVDPGWMIERSAFDAIELCRASSPSMCSGSKISCTQRPMTLMRR